MKLRKAEIFDCEQLADLRMAYLRDGGRKFSDEEASRMREKLLGYFNRHISYGGCIAYFAEVDGQIVSTAFLSIAERPPRNDVSSCLVGTVYNVYTLPQYRRHGYAKAVMTALLDDAHERGIGSVDLLASEEGKPLYEALGFRLSKHIPMQMKL